MNKIVELFAKIGDLYNNLVSKLPVDKQGHAVIGLILGLAFGARVGLAIAVVLIVGIGKEVYDYAYNHIIADIHEVSIYDALATICGGAVGILVVRLIHLIIGG